MQKKFYARINRGIEPINLKPQLPNARLRGLMLIALLILTAIILISRIQTLLFQTV